MKKLTKKQKDMLIAAAVLLSGAIFTFKNIPGQQAWIGYLAGTLFTGIAVFGLWFEFKRKK